MVITALYNIIHLGRIDISLLHRTAESFDPGRTRLCSSFLGQLGLLTIVRKRIVVWKFHVLRGDIHNILLYLIEIYSVKKKMFQDYFVLPTKSRSAMWPHLAYKYYTNSLKVEVSQSHPVLKAFCGLLLDIMVENGPIVQKMRDAEEGRERSRATNHKQTRQAPLRGRQRCHFKECNKIADSVDYLIKREQVVEQDSNFARHAEILA